MPVVVLIRYRMKPEKADLAVREIAALVRIVTAAEPGCLGISMLRNDTDERQLLLYERWTDQETYFGPHMQEAHMQEFIRRAPEFVEGPPEISVWHEI
ncbi:antibiotic biosynthesis monooxygenase [bacterium]|nr:antibiotic biosynthesis monooxygenase [bacterium]